MSKSIINSTSTEKRTNEQQFEEALKQIQPLITKICHETNNIYGLETEDLRQELNLQVFMAWQKWDPTKGTKFSTFVFLPLHQRKNELVRIYKAKFRGAGLQPESLDRPLPDGSRSSANSNRFSLQNFISDGTQSMEEMLYRKDIVDIIHETIESFRSPIAKKILLDLLNGYTQEEISKKYNCGQPNVSYYRSSFCKKLKAALRDRDYNPWNS